MIASCSALAAREVDWIACGLKTPPTNTIRALKRLLDEVLAQAIWKEIPPPRPSVVCDLISQHALLVLAMLVEKMGDRLIPSQADWLIRTALPSNFGPSTCYLEKCQVWFH